MFCYLEGLGWGVLFGLDLLLFNSLDFALKLIAFAGFRWVLYFIFMFVVRCDGRLVT